MRSHIRCEVDRDDPLFIAPIKEGGVKTASHNAAHGIHQRDDNVVAFGRYRANLPALTRDEIQLEATLAVVVSHCGDTRVTQNLRDSRCSAKAGNVRSQAVSSHRHSIPNNLILEKARRLIHITALSDPTIEFVNAFSI